MFTFSPKRLREAAEKVKQAHPESIADYRSPKFTSSDLGKQLATRLQSTEEDELEQFIEELSPIERSLYSGLIHHESESLQRRVLYGLTLDAELGEINILWMYFEGIYGQSLTQMTAQILVGLPQASEQLEHLQMELCRAVVDGEDPMDKFWLTLQQANRVERGLSNPSTYRAGTPLGKAIREHFYCQGRDVLWKSVSEDSFKEHLFRLDEDRVLDSIIQGWRIGEKRGYLHKQRCPHWLKTFLMTLEAPRSVLRQRLEEQQPEALSWYQQLRVKLRLSQFFEECPDNERFEFWQQFIPHLQEVRGDLDYQRLFLDFGSFGIIEFAESGNAAYVYNARDFREFQEMNFDKRPRNHASLKNKSRSIKRLNHRGGWQHRFRKQINQRLR